MPITVRHDVSGGALARLAALSGLTQQQNIEAAREQAKAAREQQAFLTVQGREQQDRQQAQALAAQRDMQQKQIQAAAQRQSQAADDAATRTALAFGLEKQVKEDAFNRELETIKATAKANAERWEYQYSAKARQDIARGNNALQQIAQMEASGQIDSTTAARMKQPVYNMIAGIQPDQVPVSPDKLPEEMRPGASRFDEHGNFKVRDKDGVERVEQSWYDTPEGRQKLHEQAMELKQLDIQNKEMIARQERIKKVREFMYEQSRTIDEETGKLPGGIEVSRRAIEYFGGEAIEEYRRQDVGRTTPAGPQATQEQQIDIDMPRNLIGWGRNMGVRVDSKDNWKNMARNFLKEVNKRMQAGEQISPSMTPAIQEANAILKGGG